MKISELVTLTIVKFAQVSVVIYQHHQVVKVIVGVQCHHRDI